MVADTKRKGKPEFPRNFNIGDLVNLDGDVTTIYRVDSYTENREVFESDTYMYVVYTLINVDDEHDWDEADDEDLTLVKPAIEAAKFLRNRQARERRKKRNKPTIDDKLFDLATFQALQASIPEGPMRALLGDLHAESLLKLKGGRKK